MITRTIFIILFLAVFHPALPGCAIHAHAATINAASCSQTDVQSAINTAASGDTVTIPAGSCTWTTTTANTPSVSIAAKSLTLQGAGETQTIITDGTSAAYNANEVALKISGSGSNHVRVTAIKWTGSTFDTKGVIRITSSSGLWAGAFRIDHCTWDFSTTGVVAAEIVASYGVVDHCTLQNYVGFTVTGLGHWSNNVSFTAANPVGTANAVYIEDNVFNNPVSQVVAGNMDAYDGGNYVFRNNTVVNGGLHTHETGYTAQRGVRHYEIYNNTFTSNTTSAMSRAINLRGGTGVLFGNVFTGNYTNCVDMHNYRSSDTGHNIAGYWGYCNGSNDCDGNTEGQLGYPCMDQIGRITDDDGAKATACYQAGAGPGPTQPLEPLYAWNNKCKSEIFNAALHLVDACYNGVCTSDHIQSGRDYYDETAKPAYTAYTYPHPLTGGSDTTAPVLAEVTPVSTPATATTPDYTFSSDEAGTISYGGDCTSATTAATTGNNAITFSTLGVGVHSNCTITVTDVALNASTPLAVTSFEITAGGDSTAPTVTAFVIPATSVSFTVAITTFTATDNVAVTGYLLTESATTPSVDNPGWSGTAQTQYVFPHNGAKTLYAWAKDAAGNISASLNDAVTVTVSYTVTPTAGANGSIDPATPVSVEHGSVTQFTLSPSLHYMPVISGCSGQRVGNTYTTGAITEACAVNATFVKETISITPPSKRWRKRHK